MCALSLFVALSCSGGAKNSAIKSQSSKTKLPPSMRSNAAEPLKHHQKFYDHYGEGRRPC